MHRNDLSTFEFLLLCWSALQTVIQVPAAQNLTFFGQEPFTSYISSGAAKDSQVYRLNALYNGEMDDMISYSIHTDDPDSPNYFKTSAGSKLIYVAKTPLPQQPTFSLVVEASRGDHTALSNLTINVLSATESAPRFEHESYSASIPENGESNALVTVTQAFSLAVTNTIAYLIVDGNTNSAFTISSTTGIITTSQPLDRETISQYVLTVSYVDETSSAYVDVTISVSNVNDNSPDFAESLYTITVNETYFTHLVLGIIIADDRDEDDHVTYDVIGVHSADFAVNPSGELINLVSLDYESAPFYSFILAANDNAQPPKSASVTVLIKVVNRDDECPVFSNSIYTKDLPYDPLMPPTVGVILSVSAIDPDELGNVSYAILSGNDQSLFSLDESTGNISLVKVDDSITGEYTLIVAASDSSCINQTTATIEIAIGNTNKNSPQFTSVSCHANLWENPTPGTSVVVLEAIDEDIGTFGQIQYEIVANLPDSYLFTVDPNTGNLTTTRSAGDYDRETRSSFSVGVTATDGGFLQDYCLLTITLLDTNDNQPIFDVEIYNTTVGNEDTYVLQVQAEDRDFGDNGMVSYSLHPEPTDNCPFDINQGTGVISVVNNTNIGTKGVCIMTVTAIDMGQPSLNGTAIVNITTDGTIKIPVFTEKTYTGIMAESTKSIPVVIVNASVNGSTVVYRISTGTKYRTNSQQTFDIDFDGSIEAFKDADYELLIPGPYSFRLVVEATAIGGGSSIATVIINITDINDNPPSFGSESIIDLDVVEGRVRGEIGIIQATDEDTGDNGLIEYKYESIGDTSEANVFKILSNGSVQLLVNDLDAENASIPQTYQFLITAFNPVVQSPKNDTVFLDIHIKDINDSPPRFNPSSYSISLNETQLISSTVLKVTATDPDSVDDGNLVYSILSGNERATFQMDSMTGSLILKRGLDYETVTDYDMVVEVSDGIHEDTATVSITVLDIDDEPPVFAATLYTAVVTENAPLGTTVLTVQATDQDSDEIVFEVKGQGEGRFSIDSNGVMTVNGSIDREEFLPTAQMLFLIFAYGGSLGTTDVIINVTDVNDYVPKFITSPFFGTTPENTPPGPEGLYVVTVRAIDLDEGPNGTVIYTIESGGEDGFRINSTSGIITAVTTFDREEQRFYSLTVRATDQGTPIQLFSDVEVIVEITDHNDNPPSWLYPYMYSRVYENVQVGTTVITLPVHDPDNGYNSSVVFNITGGNQLEKFTVGSTTGEIKVAKALDYEDPNDRVYMILISIRDNGVPPLSGSTVGVLEINVLDRNDHQPMFPNTSLSLVIFEDTPINSLVIVVTATDPDNGTNSEIDYTLIEGNEDDTFVVATHANGSGLLYINNKLDHETTPSYTLIIQASDRGYPIGSSELTLTIAVSDVNDEPPMFSQDVYRVSIVENNPMSVSLVQIQADDPDGDDIPGGRVERYELVGGAGDMFILQNNQWIVSVANLDREDVPEYNLTVIAVDNDLTTPLTGTVSVVITVIDVNDNPSNDGGITNIIILALDGVFPRQRLGLPYFNDPDINDSFTGCSILSGADHLFSIDPNNCSISLMVDTLQPGEYTVNIQGNDGVHLPVLSTVFVTMVTVSSNQSDLLTLTIASNEVEFLQNIYTDIQEQLSSAASTEVHIFSAQTTTDSANIDITIHVNDPAVSITQMVQSLYRMMDSLPFEVYSIPTDPCMTEPCSNFGECVPLMTVLGNGNVLTSDQLILFSPVVAIGYQCQCAVGTTGETCQTNYDDCYSNPCQYGGTCIDGLQDYSCECPAGTSGKDCGINPDECNGTNPCLNGATCRNGYDSPICLCPPDHYGDLCQYSYFETSDFCSPSPCLNGGSCSPGRDSYTCLCPESVSGTNCQLLIPFQGGCANNPCYNGSTCIISPDISEGYTCLCSPGFTGPNCRFPLNNCELEYCRNGDCEVGVYGSYRCVCDVGYTGEDCDTPLLPCDSAPCNNSGTCINNGTDSYICGCNHEHFGDNCEYSVMPPDLCIDQLCNSNNSICSSSHASFTCSCINGYSGTFCQFSSPLNHDPCNSNPCFHGSSCHSNDTGYTCTCQTGFTGEQCEININECLQEPCLNGGTCKDGSGSYLCECTESYAGRHCEVTCPIGYDGEYCEIELDQCSNPNQCLNGGTCQTVQGVYSCLCPQTHTGTNCHIPNDCSTNSCYNGGSCTNDPVTGHYCDCLEGYDGVHCELYTVSFAGSSTMSSYRAYPALGFRGMGTIQLEFAMRSSNGLLLLATQHQLSVSIDFVALEVVNGVLRVSYSLGDDPVFVNVMSSSIVVNDGQWHSVKITVNGKNILVTVDYCNTISDLSQFTVDCEHSATSNGTKQFLDATLPLWLGGAPLIPSDLPLKSVGVDGCIRGVVIDGTLLDLASSVEERNSNVGCPQIDNSCDGVDCPGGTCIRLWNDYYCQCPAQTTGETCDTAAQSLSYSGTSYAQYSLLADGGVAKRQTSATPTQVSSYQETISLWLRTETSAGTLLLLGNTSADHIHLSLTSLGGVAYSISIGDNTPLTSSLNTAVLTDGRWHNMTLVRRGLSLLITADGIALENTTIRGQDLLIMYPSSSLYFAGQPDSSGSGTVANGYSGCLQDLRLNGRSLPTSGSNDIASVTYVGAPPTAGCNVGPCFPNPCGSEGNCTEIDHDTYSCKCTDGNTVIDSSCEKVRGGPSLVPPIAIAISLSLFILILIIVMVIGLSVVYKQIRKWNKTSAAITRLNNMNHSSSTGSNNYIDDFEIHANVYHYDYEDGEDDVSVIRAVPESHTSPDPPTPPAPPFPPTLVTEPDDNQPMPPDEPPNEDNNIRNTGNARRSPVVKKTSAALKRPSTPEIDAFIESRVNSANNLITDIDSLRGYSDEGSLSEVSSLSTICSDAGYEPYTVTRLRLAGIEFERIADLLEPVLVDYDSDSESGLGSDRHININLVHNYN